MKLSRQLTLGQALNAIGEAGFDNRFRIIFGRKKWALVLVHQIGPKRPLGTQTVPDHNDGSAAGGSMEP